MVHALRSAEDIRYPIRTAASTATGFSYPHRVPSQSAKSGTCTCGHPPPTACLDPRTIPKFTPNGIEDHLKTVQLLYDQADRLEAEVKESRALIRTQNIALHHAHQLAQRNASESNELRKQLRELKSRLSDAQQTHHDLIQRLCQLQLRLNVDSKVDIAPSTNSSNVVNVDIQTDAVDEVQPVKPVGTRPNRSIRRYTWRSSTAGGPRWKSRSTGGTFSRKRIRRTRYESTILHVCFNHFFEFNGFCLLKACAETSNLFSNPAPFRFGLFTKSK
jgi:hypothetical protein